MYANYYKFSNMSNPELTLLKKQLETHNYRTSILKFQSLAYLFDSRCQFVLNSRNEFHLNNCMWSDKKARYGPDTCHCCFALESPETFFEKHMENPKKYFRVENFHDINDTLKVYKYVYKPYFTNEEESLDDFYHHRVLDYNNIFKWYELYKKKANVLKFQIKVRELKKEQKIDAVYHRISEEWHLTDCKRSVQWRLGPDTCHCQKAMQNPWKYLKEKYNFVDVQKLVKKLKNEKTPPHFYKLEEFFRNSL